MLPLYDSDALRAADALAEERFGLSGAVLMENAGHGAALALEHLFPGMGGVCLCCGGGNNGGDGFVLARHLAARGFSLAVVHTTPEDRCLPPTLTNLRALRALGVPCFPSESLDDGSLDTIMKSHPMAVDALLGTGSQGPPRGEVARVMEALGRFSGPILSLDVPSGVNASDGTVPSFCVRATHTVTFLAPKVGLFVSPGAAACGSVHVVPIGVPAKALLSPHPGVYCGVFSDFSLPSRTWHQHKGSFGTVLVVGGSSSYPGAPVLAARAVLRSGGGGVVLATPEAGDHRGAPLPEAVHCPLPGSEATEDHWSLVAPWFDRVDAVLVGPGLGRSPGSGALARRLWSQAPVPLVADADALFALAESSPPPPAGVPRLVTPHEGEASCLLACSVEAVRSRRLAAVRSLAARWAGALLKGAWSLASDGRDVVSCSTAAPILAIPGSGDVLAGVVTTLLAQGVPLLRAASLGSLWHAQSGALWASGGKDRGMRASELADALPGAGAAWTPPPGGLSLAEGEKWSHGHVP